MRHAVIQFRAVANESIPAHLRAWSASPMPRAPERAHIDADALRPRVPCRMMMAIDLVPANVATALL